MLLVDGASLTHERSMTARSQHLMRSRRGALSILVISLVGAAIIVSVPAIRRSIDRRAITTDLVPPPAGSVLPVPPFTHAYVIVLENKSFERIVGNAEAPYLAELIDRYGLAESYQAVAHPSQPNYIAMVSGSTQGIVDNGTHDVMGPTIFDQLEAAGRSWRVYAENVPPGCFTGASADGGPDGPGQYVRKHNPAISFTGISGSIERCANIQDLGALDPAAADLEIIVPNMCHGMHDCSVAEGDAWLRQVVPTIIESPAFRSGGALFITFDESDLDTTGSNRVATIIVGDQVPMGLRSMTPHSHYSLLRTLQDAWSLPCLEKSCAANTLGEFFP